MLTPKETGGSPSASPFEVAYSGLLEGGYASAGTVADTATMALGFKPTVVNTAFPLCDPAVHYLLLIVKNGSVVEVFANNASLGTYGTSAATHAALLSEALTQYAGTDCGYHSNLFVIDGAALAWETFFEPSARIEGAWLWRENPAWETPCVYRIGDRTGEIAVAVSDEVLALTSGPPANFVDGGDDNDCWFIAKAVAGKHIRFQFDVPRRVVEARLRQQSGYNHGEWKWQACNDGETWIDLSEPFTMGGSTSAILGDLGGNGASYTHYQLLGMGGYLSATPYLYAIEFRDCAASDSAYGPGGGRYEFLDCMAPGADSSGNGNHWDAPGSQSTDTPTNNLPVINPLPDVGWLLTEGNRSFEGHESVAFMKATLPCFDGCYWELAWTAASGAAAGVISDGVGQAQDVGSSWVAGNSDVHRFDGTGGSFPASVPDAGVLGFAYKNGNLWMSVDGVWDGDPVAFAGPVDATIAGEVFPFVFDRFASNIPCGVFRFAGHDLAYSPPAGFKPFGG
ncbi:hypothetical protein [Pseudodesulfovibrio portus]|uniref:F5/8 type C domain-containing protein n=1 Tax=Pseudodesulfovibrio portus TaxID=231439 RepID=A0ABM8ARJ1_9BACT|nr:hypothetical protein [Pseudodesulfovibrio portus]BDQ34057.1 hypothetical protein JCM14722_15990 [Pseudodesulfovibrio portus]